MGSSISFASFFFMFLHVLWSDKLYVNGCYRSIIGFGDSLTDTGNSKQMNEVSGQKVFCPSPYGETFFHQPTGRCSNGRLIIDFLAERLGLPLVPPSVNGNGIDNAVAFRQGVNYAVVGATSINSSIIEARGIVNPFTNASLGVQLEWFKQSLPSICGNATDCRNFVGSSVILMGEFGGSDYEQALTNGTPVDEMGTLVHLVIDSIASAIDDLIEMGTRTLVIPGSFPIGCFAVYLTMFHSEKEEYDSTTGCLIRINKIAEYQNELLITKLNQMRELYPNVNIIYADYYNAAMQIYRSPDKFGFTNGALKACCGSGGPLNFNSSTPCGYSPATACDQPDTYFSWDGIHPTEAACKIISDSVFGGSYTTPQFNSLCATSTSQLEFGLSSTM